MILLDTNVLINALVKGSAAARAVTRWIEQSEQLSTSSICWYEFVSGPVDESGIRLMKAILGDRIVPFTSNQAQEASRLWNLTGRQKRVRIDAMIAAAALEADASLATANVDDFRPFVAHGLRIEGL